MRKYNLSITQKICFAGIFIVLVAILQKVIPPLPFAPFIRVSLGGCALIMFSSILLGPWFGLLVGAASDLIGFAIFDPKTVTAFPMFQITFIYALLGFISYFVFKWIMKIKKDNIAMIVELATFGVIATAVSLIVNLVPSITLYGKEYTFDLTAKILIPIISFILLGLLFIINFFIDRRFKKKEKDISVYKISFACFLLELGVMLLFGSAMKTWGFNMFYGVTPFIYVFICQLIVGLFNIPINTLIISYITLFSDRMFKQY